MRKAIRSAAGRRFPPSLNRLGLRFGSRPDHDPEAMALQPFYLAYQEQDNRDLLARYGALSTEIMRRWLERQRVARAQPPRRGHLRVGIVSAHIFDHSVWTAPMKGWVGRLDRGRFEVDVFYLGQKQDQETLFAKSHAAHFEQGPKGLREWVQTHSRPAAGRADLSGARHGSR